MANQTAEKLSRDEYFYGHKACAGCGGALAVRAALKVLGQNAVSVLPAGCMSAVGFNFPQLCFSNNSIISTFAGTASMLTGIEAGLRARGYSDFTAVGFAGDGGTADIGIQALSGAILVGSNSTLTLKLSDGSTFTGFVGGSITNAKGNTVSTEVGAVSVTLDGTSTWTLTADSYVTSFSGDAANVISNGFTLYVNGVALTGTK